MQNHPSMSSDTEASSSSDSNNSERSRRLRKDALLRKWPKIKPFKQDSETLHIADILRKLEKLKEAVENVRMDLSNATDEQPPCIQCRPETPSDFSLLSDIMSGSLLEKAIEIEEKLIEISSGISGNRNTETEEIQAVEKLEREICRIYPGIEKTVHLARRIECNQEVHGEREAATQTQKIMLDIETQNNSEPRRKAHFIVNKTADEDIYHRGKKNQYRQIITTTEKLLRSDQQYIHMYDTILEDDGRGPFDRKILTQRSKTKLETVNGMEPQKEVLERRRVTRFIDNKTKQVVELISDLEKQPSDPNLKPQAYPQAPPTSTMNSPSRKSIMPIASNATFAFRQPLDNLVPVGDFQSRWYMVKSRAYLKGSNESIFTDTLLTDRTTSRKQSNTNYIPHSSPADSSVNVMYRKMSYNNNANISDSSSRHQSFWVNTISYLDDEVPRNSVNTTQRNTSRDDVNASANALITQADRQKDLTGKKASWLSLSSCSSSSIDSTQGLSNSFYRVNQISKNTNKLHDQQCSNQTINGDLRTKQQFQNKSEKKSKNPKGNKSGLPFEQNYHISDRLSHDPNIVIVNLSDSRDNKFIGDLEAQPDHLIRQTNDHEYKLLMTERAPKPIDTQFQNNLQSSIHQQILNHHEERDASTATNPYLSNRVSQSRPPAGNENQQVAQYNLNNKRIFEQSKPKLKRQFPVNETEEKTEFGDSEYLSSVSYKPNKSRQTNFFEPTGNSKVFVNRSFFETPFIKDVTETTNFQPKPSKIVENPKSYDRTTLNTSESGEYEIHQDILNSPPSCQSYEPNVPKLIRARNTNGSPKHLAGLSGHENSRVTSESGNYPVVVKKLYVKDEDFESNGITKTVMQSVLDPNDVASQIYAANSSEKMLSSVSQASIADEKDLDQTEITSTTTRNSQKLENPGKQLNQFEPSKQIGLKSMSRLYASQQPLQQPKTKVYPPSIFVIVPSETNHSATEVLSVKENDSYFLQPDLSKSRSPQAQEMKPINNIPTENGSPKFSLHSSRNEKLIPEPPRVAPIYSAIFDEELPKAQINASSVFKDIITEKFLSDFHPEDALYSKDSKKQYFPPEAAHKKKQQRECIDSASGSWPANANELMPVKSASQTTFTHQQPQTAEQASRALSPNLQSISSRKPVSSKVARDDASKTTLQNIQPRRSTSRFTSNSRHGTVQQSFLNNILGTPGEHGVRNEESALPSVNASEAQNKTKLQHADRPVSNFGKPTRSMQHFNNPAEPSNTDATSKKSLENFEKTGLISAPSFQDASYLMTKDDILQSLLEPKEWRSDESLIDGSGSEVLKIVYLGGELHDTNSDAEFIHKPDEKINELGDVEDEVDDGLRGKAGEHQVDTSANTAPEKQYKHKKKPVFRPQVQIHFPTVEPVNETNKIDAKKSVKTFEQKSVKTLAPKSSDVENEVVKKFGTAEKGVSFAHFPEIRSYVVDHDKPLRPFRSKSSVARQGGSTSSLTVTVSQQSRNGMQQSITSTTGSTTQKDISTRQRSGTSIQSEVGSTTSISAKDPLKSSKSMQQSGASTTASTTQKNLPMVQNSRASIKPDATSATHLSAHIPLQSRKSMQQTDEIPADSTTQKSMSIAQKSEAGTRSRVASATNLSAKVTQQSRKSMQQPSASTIGSTVQKGIFMRPTTEASIQPQPVSATDLSSKLPQSSKKSMQQSAASNTVSLAQKNMSVKQEIGTSTANVSKTTPQESIKSMAPPSPNTIGSTAQRSMSMKQRSGISTLSQKPPINYLSVNTTEQPRESVRQSIVSTGGTKASAAMTQTNMSTRHRSGNQLEAQQQCLSNKLAPYFEVLLHDDKEKLEESRLRCLENLEKRKENGNNQPSVAETLPRHSIASSIKPPPDKRQSLLEINSTKPTSDRQIERASKIEKVQSINQTHYKAEMPAKPSQISDSKSLKRESQAVVSTNNDRISIKPSQTSHRPSQHTIASKQTSFPVREQQNSDHLSYQQSKQSEAQTEKSIKEQTSPMSSNSGKSIPDPKEKDISEVRSPESLREPSSNSSYNDENPGVAELITEPVNQPPREEEETIPEPLSEIPEKVQNQTMSVAPTNDTQTKVQSNVSLKAPFPNIEQPNSQGESQFLELSPSTAAANQKDEAISLKSNSKATVKEPSTIIEKVESMVESFMPSPNPKDETQPASGIERASKAALPTEKDSSRSTEETQSEPSEPSTQTENVEQNPVSEEPNTIVEARLESGQQPAKESKPQTKPKLNIMSNAARKREIRRTVRNPPEPPKSFFANNFLSRFISKPASSDDGLYRERRYIQIAVLDDPEEIPEGTTNMERFRVYSVKSRTMHLTDSEIDAICEKKTERKKREARQARRGGDITLEYMSR